MTVKAPTKMMSIHAYILGVKCTEMIRLSCYIFFILFSIQVRPESIPCIYSENDVFLDAPVEIYQIEIATEEGLLDVSIELDKNIDTLDLLAVGVRREVDGQINFAAVLNFESHGERNTAHILAIPETEIDQYSFLITYRQKNVECPQWKQFNIPVTLNKTRNELNGSDESPIR